MQKREIDSFPLIKKGYGLAAGIVISIISFTSYSFAQEDNRGYIVKVGQAAPDFSLTTTGNDVFTLSEMKGKVVMIQFTASWCGVCRKEMPHIEEEIWQAHKDKDFVLLGIDLDEPRNVVREFARKMKITYPLAPDPDGHVFYTYAAKGAGVTRNVIIDRNGKIVFLTRLYNREEFSAMSEVINSLLIRRK